MPCSNKSSRTNSKSLYQVSWWVLGISVESYLVCFLLASWWVGWCLPPESLTAWPCWCTRSSQFQHCALRPRADIVASVMKSPEGITKSFLVNLEATHLWCSISPPRSGRRGSEGRGIYLGQVAVCTTVIALAYMHAFSIEVVFQQRRACFHVDCGFYMVSYALFHVDCRFYMSSSCALQWIHGCREDRKSVV